MTGEQASFEMLTMINHCSSLPEKNKEWEREGEDQNVGVNVTRKKREKIKRESEILILTAVKGIEREQGSQPG
ncbi:unnamed protein product [Boreogadus saida]